MRGENRKFPPLTAEQLAKARALRAQTPPVAWVQLGVIFGVPGSKVRRAIDPKFAEYERSRNVSYEQRMRHRRARHNEARQRDAIRCGRVQGDPEVRNPAFDPLRDGDRVWATPGAELMGDPAIGHSALDKRSKGL